MMIFEKQKTQELMAVLAAAVRDWCASMPHQFARLLLHPISQRMTAGDILPMLLRKRSSIFPRAAWKKKWKPANLTPPATVDLLLLLSS